MGLLLQLWSFATMSAFMSLQPITTAIAPPALTSGDTTLMVTPNILINISSPVLNATDYFHIPGTDINLYISTKDPADVSTTDLRHLLVDARSMIRGKVQSEPSTQFSNGSDNFLRFTWVTKYGSRPGELLEVLVSTYRGEFLSWKSLDDVLDGYSWYVTDPYRSLSHRVGIEIQKGSDQEEVVGHLSTWFPR